MAGESPFGWMDNPSFGYGMLGLGGLQSLFSAYSKMQEDKRRQQLMQQFQDPNGALAYYQPLSQAAQAQIGRNVSGNLAQSGLTDPSSPAVQQRVSDSWASLEAQRAQQAQQAYMQALSGAAGNIPQAAGGGGLQNALMMLGFMRGNQPQQQQAPQMAQWGPSSGMGEGGGGWASSTTPATYGMENMNLNTLGGPLMQFGNQGF